VVLLLAHPGPNLLGRYLPLSLINALLLAEPPLARLSAPQVDVFMSEIGEGSDVENADTMDLATFLEYAPSSLPFPSSLTRHRFAIQATHCLENLHR
jgi:hypothetical protein